MRFQRLPITARIPLIVALFMLAVSIFTSQRVLSRLADTQARQVQALADVYLDGLALALVDSMVREDVWQVFDVLDRSRRRPGEIRPAQTIVAGADGLVIASSDPISIPSQTHVPAHYAELLHEDGKIATADDARTAYARREVVYENLPVGSIYAAIDIAPLLTERQTVLWTLILTNAALTLLFAGAGWLIVGRMMRPVGILTDHLEMSNANNVQAIPDAVVQTARPEYRRAFAAYNALATAMRERETLAARLAEEERMASLGRLASGMAHEINNPLGGLFNAIDTLKRHDSDVKVRATAISLIERGLRGIRDVVRSTLMTYRADRDERALRPEDIDDMKLLVMPEARRRGVLLHWRSDLQEELPVSASAIRQILLNLVLNACQASPKDASANVLVTSSGKMFEIVVEDEGPGLPARGAAMLEGGDTVPAPIGEGSGLGLWMTNRLVREARGSVRIEAGNGGGTRITVSIPLARSTELRHVA